MVRNPVILAFLVLVSAGTNSQPIDASPVIAPSFTRIAYDRPEQYVDVPAGIGPSTSLIEIVKEMRATTFRSKLYEIRRWMNSNLRETADDGSGFRSLDAIIDSGKFRGESEYALVFGTLARSRGIPTIWVKSLPIEFLQEWQPGQELSGRLQKVWLELYWGNRWVLLDGDGHVLYEKAGNRCRLLPSSHWAYDKGGDPSQMLLPVHGEPWEKQTAHYAASLDSAELPASKTNVLFDDSGDVWLIAEGKTQETLQETLHALGQPFTTRSMDPVQTWLPQARGAILLVASIGAQDPVPPVWRQAIQGGEMSALIAKNAGQAHWSKRHVLIDGTRVVLVYGATADDLRRELRNLRLPK